MSDTKKKKIEIYIIIILIIFSISIYLFVHFLSDNKSSKGILVYVGGQLIKEIGGEKISLEKDGVYKIGDDILGYNIIEIKDKKVRIIDADCPDKICVSHGYLKDFIDNDMIVCAPHSLIIIYEK